jgi:SprT protein
MQAILDKIAELKTVAEQKGYPLPPLAVKFDLKGAASGQAFRKNGQCVVRFNLAIAKENIEEFLVRTVPHELAHILQFIHRPRVRPHGPEWQSFCRILIGKTIPRCHSYEVAHLKRKVERKKYLYSCGCRTIHLSSVKHGRIQKGVRYSCVKCKNAVRPINLLTRVEF